MTDDSPHTYRPSTSTSSQSLSRHSIPKHEDPSWDLLPSLNKESQDLEQEKPSKSIETIDFGPGDPENPFNWPKSKKWRITILTCFLTFAVQMNGTAMTSAAEQINDSFNISDANFPNSYWPILSWNLGGALAPLLGLPLMESFGVRWSYVVTYVALIILLVPQAVAQNFATLIVTRVFSGGCSGVLANITGGVVSDVWRDGRSKSFGQSLFIWCLLAGTSMGPVIGSVILKYASWRWIFYQHIIVYGAFLPFVLFLLHEVRPDVILIKRAKHIRATTGKSAFATAEQENKGITNMLSRSIIRPSHMLATESVVFSFGLWSAFCIGTAFMFTQSITQVYSNLYDWSYFGTGVVQSAVVVGELLGLLASRYQDHVYFTSASKNTENPGRPIPEARLYLSIPGSFIGLTAGLFWYAWTSYAYLHWILPTVGLAFVGFGMFTIVSAVTGYLLDAYSKYAASAMAGVAFMENLFAGVLPLAVQSMYTNLGFNWASSLLGFLALALSFIPLVLQRYGPGIRRKSPFMLQAGHAEI